MKEHKNLDQTQVSKVTLHLFAVTYRENKQWYLVSGMFKMRLGFPTLIAAKPLVTEGTNGCQIRDMDLIFSLQCIAVIWFTVDTQSVLVVWLQPPKVE